MSLQQETDSFIQQKTEWRWGRLFLCLQLTNSLKVNFKVEIERSLFVLHSCFSNEIEATLNRLKKLEKDLTVKEKELREVWVVFFYCTLSLNLRLGFFLCTMLLVIELQSHFFYGFPKLQGLNYSYPLSFFPHYHTRLFC